MPFHRMNTYPFCTISIMLTIGFSKYEVIFCNSRYLRNLFFANSPKTGSLPVSSPVIPPVNGRLANCSSSKSIELLLESEDHRVRSLIYDLLFDTLTII